MANSILNKIVAIKMDILSIKLMRNVYLCRAITEIIYFKRITYYDSTPSILGNGNRLHYGGA